MKDFLYTIILLGAIQGIIICSALFLSRRRTLSTRLLAGIIGLITLPGIHLYFHYAGLFDTNELVLFIHDIVPMVVIMPLGPLIYFYIRSLLEPEFKLGSKQRLHFIPVVIDLLPKLGALEFYFGSWLGWAPSNRDQLAGVVEIHCHDSDIPGWIYMTIYELLAAGYLHAYMKKQTAQSPAAITRWLQLFIRLFIAFQLIWLVFLVPYILPAYSGWLMGVVDWFPVYIPMSILIYWLGIKGYLVASSMKGDDKKTSPLLPGPLVSEALGLLKRSMEEDRLYLNPALNLEKLSQHTGLTPKNISAVLNQYMETSFNTFINQYRVQEFKSRLSRPGGEHLTIVGLAMECGFNSPATFQRTFKQYTGLSPSAFRKTLENSGLSVE